MKKNNQTAQYQRLKDLECPDSTAPFEPHTIFKSGIGSILKDIAGKEHVDLSGGFGALALGHNHQSYKQCMSNHLNQNLLVHGNGDVFANQPKIELLAKLKELFEPHYQKFALSLSGSQAVEYAMKTAILKTGKSGFISLKHGYHGLDIGVLSSSTNPYFYKPFDSFLSRDHFEFLSTDFNEQQLDVAIQKIKSRSCGFAGIILEPIVGRGGVIEISDLQMKLASELSHKNGGLLILDEVLVGLGRCGRWSYGPSVDADISCFGKILGGGLPLSAIAAKEDVMRAWPDSKGEAIHTGTFFGHPLSCSLAVNTLDEINKLDLLNRSLEIGQLFRQKIKDQLFSTEEFVEVRGQGLMVGIEFKSDLKGVELSAKLLEKGYVVIPAAPHGNMISLTPALNIDPILLDTFLADLTELLK